MVPFHGEGAKDKASLKSTVTNTALKCVGGLLQQRDREL
jgi:hypothetical protein